MVSAVPAPVTTQDTDIPALNSMELRTQQTTKSTQVLQSVHKVMRMHGMQDTLAYSLQSSMIHSRQLLQLRALTLICFVGLFSTD